MHNVNLENNLDKVLHNAPPLFPSKSVLHNIAERKIESSYYFFVIASSLLVTPWGWQAAPPCLLPLIYSQTTYPYQCLLKSTVFQIPILLTMINKKLQSEDEKVKPPLCIIDIALLWRDHQRNPQNARAIIFFAALIILIAVLLGQ